MKNKYLNIFQNFFCNESEAFVGIVCKKEQNSRPCTHTIFLISQKISSVVLFCVGMRKNVHTFLPTRLIQFSRLFLFVLQIVKIEDEKHFLLGN